jgi:hypothetical protein
MKKTLRTHPISRAGVRKASGKTRVVRQKTAAGVRFSVSYPVPQKRKGYRPDEQSQLGQSDTTSLAMSAFYGF